VPVEHAWAHVIDLDLSSIQEERSTPGTPALLAPEQDSDPAHRQRVLTQPLGPVHEVTVEGASPEHIPTNILADRLKRLEAAGLVAPVAYSEHPPRYEYHLTESGRTLGPVVDALAVWGLAQFPGTRRPSRTRSASV
jgi:hypothetical protein